MTALKNTTLKVQSCDYSSLKIGKQISAQNMYVLFTQRNTCHQSRISVVIPEVVSVVIRSLI